MIATASKGTAVVTLPSPTEITITRTFNAPARLVYAAWTTPDLVRQWWSANRGAMTVCDIDLRVGGAWRWVMLTEDGFEVGFHGVYHDLSPYTRIIATEAYEGFPEANAESLNTMTFSEHDGQTTLIILVQHKTQEHRDAHINSGMESGMQDAMDLLEQAVLAIA